MIKEAIRPREKAEYMTLISKINAPVKFYPNTLQRLAKHFWYAGSNGNIIVLADELEQYTNIKVICVTDEMKRPVGIIRRDKLSVTLARRFGRELMSRTTIGECAENVKIYTGKRNIFSVLEQLRELNRNSDHFENIQNYQNEYLVLVDSQGVFSGMLSLQDVTDYLMEMTNDDIAQASILQERLLANTGEIKQIEINMDAWWSSAKGVGGDFYFIRKLSDRRFFATLCDVSGKGVTAALVVSIVWGFLQSHDMQKGLKDLLINLNSSIVNSFHLEKFLTGVFLIYDARAGLLRMADMGHAHTVFLRNGKSVSLQKIRVNLPVGVEININPMIYSFTVETGDILLIYSDGITEQDNPAGEEFGEKRLTALVKKAAAENIPLSEILPKTLEEFRRSTPQHDDMTFLLFRF